MMELPLLRNITAVIEFAQRLFYRLPFAFYSVLLSARKERVTFTFYLYTFYLLPFISADTPIERTSILRSLLCIG